MKNCIKINIQIASGEEGEILMASLADSNYYAFEFDKDELVAYISEEDFNESILQSIITPKTTYTCTIIYDRNWNEEWERQLQPIIINHFAGIRASFHEPLQNIEHEIIITPKMSFGTGHHPTTYLMIEMMAKINFKNKTVLDFGTGTGVLAILAEKLEAAHITAVDYDEWGINNAKENILANNCNRINLFHSDTIIGLPVVDIILANINLNVLKENIQNFSKIAKPGTQLLVSGILLKDEEELVLIFSKNGLVKNQNIQREGWLAIQFENQ